MIRLCKEKHRSRSESKPHTQYGRNSGRTAGQQNGTRSYGYDADGELTAVDGGGTAAYTYDGAGKRVQKAVGGAATEYVFFGGQVIAERASGTWTDYVFANGGRVARATGSASSGTVYYHGDHLGTVRMETDESGLSQRPHRVRTWAPRGQTPVLQYCFNWENLSSAAGLTPRQFYFRLYPGTIKKDQVLDFPKAVVRRLPGPPLLIWDRLPAHRSRVVQDYIASLGGWIHHEFVPPYAPELNPVEYIWSYWKQHELPNVCPKDYWQLSEGARRTLRRMRRRPRLITAFWKRSSLRLD